MIADDCFKKLNYRPNMIHKFNFLNHCNTTENIMSDLDFKAYPIDKDIILEEKLFQDINLQFPIMSGLIIYFKPYCYYRWHKDSNRKKSRGVTINILYTARNTSLSLFGSNEVENQMMNDVIHLDYEIDTLYLFNTQIKHCIVNLHEPRYIFSLIFKQEKDSLSYNDLKEYLKNDTIL
jgi:hypothetical protein